MPRKYVPASYRYFASSCWRSSSVERRDGGRRLSFACQVGPVGEAELDEHQTGLHADRTPQRDSTRGALGVLQCPGIVGLSGHGGPTNKKVGQIGY